MIRQGKSALIKVGQGSTVGENETQDQAKELEIHLLPLLGVLQNIKLKYMQKTFFVPL